MTVQVPEMQLWQQNLASLIRYGRFTRAAIDEIKGLHTVVGVYNDERLSARIAKYSNPRRAADAASVVNRLAKAG
jgi:hypothetical protein